MEKDFFDVFPILKVKKELEELLDMVFVTKFPAILQELI